VRPVARNRDVHRRGRDLRSAVRGSSKTLRYRIPSRQRRQDARFRPRVAEIQGDERLHPPRVKLTSASRVVTYRHAARFTDRVRLCFIRTPCRASSRDNSSFTEIARKVTTPITVDGAPNRYRGRGRRIAAEPDHITPAIGTKTRGQQSRFLSGPVSEERIRGTIQSPAPTSETIFQTATGSGSR
jgi:hypothetical protein